MKPAMKSGWIVVALLAAVACSKAEPKQAQNKAAEATPAQAVKAIEVSGRRIDVTVKKTGYTPEKIDVAKGEQVTLVFTRVEPTECGQEVQIPSLGVKEQLPLNQPVAIALKREESGAVEFVCGMGMMKGSIVVP